MWLATSYVDLSIGKKMYNEMSRVTNIVYGINIYYVSCGEGVSVSCSS